MAGPKIKITSVVERISSDERNRMAEKLFVRLASTMNEWAWACGQLVPPDFVPPADWVRHAYRALLGFAPVDREYLKTLSPEELLQRLGWAVGFGETAKIAFSMPPPDDLNENVKTAYNAFRESVTPLLGKLEAAISELPDSVYKNSPGEFAVFSKGKGMGAEYLVERLANDEVSPPFRRLIAWILITFREEIYTAKSLPELYRWIETMDLPPFSLKTLEKVCAEFGFSYVDK